MSADSKLYSAEDSLKDKYSGILNRMSHVELKQFKKYEYKLIVLDETKELLPAESQSRLDQTALCVSNFLQNEVQKLLRRKPRKSTEHSTQLLSETFLNDLDITLQSNENKADIDHDSSDDDSELILLVWMIVWHSSKKQQGVNRYMRIPLMHPRQNPNVQPRVQNAVTLVRSNPHQNGITIRYVVHYVPSGFMKLVLG